MSIKKYITLSRADILLIVLLLIAALLIELLSGLLEPSKSYALENEDVPSDLNEYISEEDIFPTPEQMGELNKEYQKEKEALYNNCPVTTLPEVESSLVTINEEDAITLAKLLYGECRGIPNKAEKEAVVWCVLNRVDNSRFPDTVYGVVTAKGQFAGYNVNNPVWDELLEISESVLKEWGKEKIGEASVRSLPSDYFFFHGDGVHNWFRKEYKDKSYYKF